MSVLRNALRHGKLGMESHAVTEEPADGETKVVDMPVNDEVAEAIDGAVNDHDDAVDMEVVADEVTEVAEGLESILVTMRASLESGGLNPQAAQFAGLAIQGIGGRYGITANTMPSTESFGTRSSQMAQTRIAVESLTDKLKSAYEYVKEAIAKMVAKIKDFYLRMFDAAARLKKHAAAVAKKADNVGNDAPSEKEVTIGKALANKLVINGKLPNIKSEMASLKTLTDKVLKESATNTTKMANDVAAAVKAIKVDSDDAFTSSVSSLDKVEIPKLSALGNDVTSDARFKSIKDATIHSSDELPGGRAFFHQSGKGGDGVTGALARIKAVKFDADAFKADAKEIDEQKESVISTADIRAIASSVEELAAEVEDFKRNSDVGEKAAKTLTDSADAFAKSLDKAELSASNQTQAGKVLNMLPSVSSAATSATAKYIRYAIPTAQAGLKYAETHLAMYK